MTTVHQLLSQQCIIILSSMTALAKNKLLFSLPFKDKIFGRALIVTRSGGISGTGGGQNQSNYSLRAIA